MSQPEPIYPDAIRPTSYQDGLEFQDFVCRELAREGIIVQNLQSKRWQFDVGENLQGFEIKQDQRCFGTGRVSIEVEEKTKASNPEWVRSGIYRDDNSWLYILGNEEGFFIFSKKVLRRFAEQRKPKIEESHGTIRKFYIELRLAEYLAEKVIRPRGAV